jgi:hypothetical protein
MVLNCDNIELKYCPSFNGQFFRSSHTIYPVNVSCPYHLNAFNDLEHIWLMKSGMWLPTFCSRPKNSNQDGSENYVCDTKAKLGKEGMEWISTHIIFDVLTVALEKISVFWVMIPLKLIVCSNALVELAAFLCTICTVKGAGGCKISHGY